MLITTISGDCRDVMPAHGPFDMIIADPPYGDTSLPWDKRVSGWESLAASALKPSGSMWVFGSLRFFMTCAAEFADAGLNLAQEIVWEKQNGSGFSADRFRRVHEFAVQFYRSDALWRDVYNDVQKTSDGTKKTVRRKRRPTHTGNIGASSYVSHDGGPRIMRSVIYMPNCHGSAIHPTEKPVGLIEILVRTSCPPGGLVGDWFAGSVAAGIAAQQLGRRYIGCEIDEEMAEKAKERLSGLLPLVCVGGA
jgi:site-specific DNA-methyltransferase (adenine-specific)